MDDYRIQSDGTVLFCALAIESAMNFYGVVRLGEKFYQDRYERLGLVQKVSALLATCLGQLVEKDDRIVLLAIRMSELRNRLAHPKTREIDSFDDLGERRTLLEEAEESVRVMEDFFKEFLVADPDSLWILQSA